MFQEIQSILYRIKVSLGFLLLGFLLTNCVLFEGKPILRVPGLPSEKVYSGSFDDVWRATQLALQSPTSYPLRLNNSETGVIETEFIKGSLIWQAPNSESSPGGGYAYKIVARVIKGSLSGKTAYKVTLQKTIQVQRDFFSEPETLPSDGLEEKVILYRIERELQLDRAIKRFSKKQSQGA